MRKEGEGYPSRRTTACRRPPGCGTTWWSTTSAAAGAASGTPGPRPGPRSEGGVVAGIQGWFGVFAEPCSARTPKNGPRYRSSLKQRKPDRGRPDQIVHVPMGFCSHVDGARCSVPSIFDEAETVHGATCGLTQWTVGTAKRSVPGSAGVSPSCAWCTGSAAPPTLAPSRDFLQF